MKQIEKCFKKKVKLTKAVILAMYYRSKNQNKLKSNEFCRTRVRTTRLS